jgi:hypothetical protein
MIKKRLAASSATMSARYPQAKGPMRALSGGTLVRKFQSKGLICRLPCTPTVGRGTGVDRVAVVVAVPVITAVEVVAAVAVISAVEVAAAVDVIVGVAVIALVPVAAVVAVTVAVMPEVGVVLIVRVGVMSACAAIENNAGAPPTTFVYGELCTG